MAERLALSRKTYILFESQRWLPAKRQRAHTLKALHVMSEPLAKAFAAACGDDMTSVALVLAAPGPAAAPALDPKHAKLAVEAALYAAAEEADLSPKVVRAIAACLLGRLAEAGVGMAQAAAFAKGAVAAKT